jgi:hypothetical protein
MASLLENFIRRIEKLLTSRASVPPPGTNHVEDNWENTDIYPGEFSANLDTGELYTSDGESIIDLNRENFILSGLAVSKDTSGVLKLTVSDGHLRLNGRSYYHLSTGTDLILPPNTGSNPILYFVYGEATTGVYGTGASGNYQLSLNYAGVAGSVNEPGGIFSAVAGTAGNPTLPADSLMLGTVLLNPGSTGYDLWPLSVATLGDYYPKFSITPSEFLRDSVQQVTLYEAHRLYFPDHIVIESASNTMYKAMRMFVSDYSSITNDILNGNLNAIGGISGPSGASGSMTAANVGTGTGVYKTTVGSQFQFRTISGTGPVQVNLSGTTNEVSIGLTLSGLVTGATNVGSGSAIFSGTTGSTGQILKLRSLTAGTNITIGVSGDNIVISSSGGGSASSGINLGAASNADVFAGMSGNDLTFRRLTFGTGMSGTQNTNDINIFTTVKNNDGVNKGGGPGQVYGGMSGSSLIFRTLTGSGGITITTGSDTITINGPTATGGSSTASGINIGYTGSTVGQVFAGLSGTDLTFRSLIAGPGVNINYQDPENIEIGVNVSDGFQGFQGPSATDGFQGYQGWQGADGFQGFQGPQGWQGFGGFQGFQGFGFQGPQGDRGPTGSAGTVTPLRYIELYDPTGGWTVTQGGIYYVPFDTQRGTNGSGLYTTSSIFNTVSPDGTGISVSETGNYLIMYTVSATIKSGLGMLVQLFNTTTSTVVPGSTVIASPNGDEICSVTGKVILNLSNTNVYAVRISTIGGKAGETIVGFLGGSSFTFIKLEALGEGGTGTGGSGGSGFQGFQGPTGSGSGTGFQGFQGATGPGNLGKNSQSGTSYTLALTDVNKMVEMTSASTNTITVPPDSSVNFPAGSQILVVQNGTGQTGLTSGVGVSILSDNGKLKLASRYSSATLVKDTVANQWYLFGNLTL